jgi:hypothetical protein
MILRAAGEKTFSSAGSMFSTLSSTAARRNVILRADASVFRQVNASKWAKSHPFE